MGSRGSAETRRVWRSRRFFNTLVVIRPLAAPSPRLRVNHSFFGLVTYTACGARARG